VIIPKIRMSYNFHKLYFFLQCFQPTNKINRYWLLSHEILFYDIHKFSSERDRSYLRICTRGLLGYKIAQDF
jgi:hypothetical protein